MANKLPYYPMYVNDFDNDPNVIDMNIAEMGLYLAALNAAWTFGSIPDNAKDLARLIRKDYEDVERAWPVVRRLWIPAPDQQGRLVNKRQEVERAKANNRSENATKGGIARATKHKKSQQTLILSRARAGAGAQAGAERELEPELDLSRSGACAESVLRAYDSHSVSKKVKNDPLVSRFEDLVRAWPAGKLRDTDFGAQSWISLINTGEISAENVGEVFAGLERWKTSQQWLDDDGKFIPSLANQKGSGWLQRKAWRDHPPQANRDQIIAAQKTEALRAREESAPKLKAPDPKCPICRGVGFESKKLEDDSFEPRICPCRKPMNQNSANGRSAHNTSSGSLPQNPAQVQLRDGRRPLTSSGPPANAARGSDADFRNQKIPLPRDGHNKPAPLV